MSLTIGGSNNYGRYINNKKPQPAIIDNKEEIQRTPNARSSESAYKKAYEKAK